MEKSSSLTSTPLPSNIKPIYWNFPAANPNFTGREPLLTELHKILHGSSNNKANQNRVVVTACHGLGGIGKTQLVTEYVYRHLKDYNCILWIFADKLEQIEIAYGQFAHKIKLPIAHPSETVMEVIDWLQEQTRCLLIFDNAHDSTTIQNYLPKIGNHHVIIPSGDGKWVGPKLEVDVFTLEEAKDYLKQFIAAKETNKDIETLANILGCLPLALAQAGAYIAETDLSINDYLKKYHANQKEYLNENNLPVEKKHEPIFKTWDITFQAIKQQNPLANHLMILSAYCQSDNIPFNLFQQASILFNAKENDSTNISLTEKAWDDARALLKRYAIWRVEGNAKTISIHPLVQTVIRLQQTRDATYRTLQHLMKITHALYPYMKNTLEDYAVKRIWLPHLTQFLLHWDMWLKQAPDNIQPSVEKEAVLTLLNYLWNGYVDLGDAKRQREYLERALKIKEAHYPKDHPQIAFTLTNLGIAYGDLGDSAKQRELLERALKIFEVQHERQHPEVRVTLHNLGYCYHLQNEVAKAKETFERASTIQANAATHCEYGLLLTHQNEWKLAIQQFEWAMQRAQTTSWLNYGLSAKPLFDKYLQQALDTYKVIRIHSTALAYYWLIRCYHCLNQLEACEIKWKAFCQWVHEHPNPLHDVLLAGLKEDFSFLSQEFVPPKTNNTSSVASNNNTTSVISAIPLSQDMLNNAKPLDAPNNSKINSTSLKKRRHNMENPSSLDKANFPASTTTADPKQAELVYDMRSLFVVKDRTGKAINDKRVASYKDARKIFKQFLKEELIPYCKQQINNKPVTVFISYAWAIEKSATYQIDKFYETCVEKLARDLKESCGIKVYLDRWYDRAGKPLTEFLEEAFKNAHYFLVIGTKLYLEKYEKRAQLEKDPEHIVRAEGTILNYLATYNSQKRSSIIPILLENSLEETLPSLLRPNLPVIFKDHDYFEPFFYLIRCLYSLDPDDKKFKKLKQSFYRKLQENVNSSVSEGKIEVITMKEKALDPDTNQTPAKKVAVQSSKQEQTYNVVQTSLSDQEAKSLTNFNQIPSPTFSTMGSNSNQPIQSGSEWEMFTHFCETQFYQEAFVKLEQQLSQATLICYVLFDTNDEIAANFVKVLRSTLKPFNMFLKIRKDFFRESDFIEALLDKSNIVFLATTAYSFSHIDAWKALAQPIWKRTADNDIIPLLVDNKQKMKTLKKCLQQSVLSNVTPLALNNASETQASFKLLRSFTRITKQESLSLLLEKHHSRIKANLKTLSKLEHSQNEKSILLQSFKNYSTTQSEIAKAELLQQVGSFFKEGKAPEIYTTSPHATSMGTTSNVNPSSNNVSPSSSPPTFQVQTVSGSGNQVSFSGNQINFSASPSFLHPGFWQQPTSSNTSNFPIMSPNANNYPAKK